MSVFARLTPDGLQLAGATAATDDLADQSYQAAATTTRYAVVCRKTEGAVRDHVAVDVVYGVCR